MLFLDGFHLKVRIMIDVWKNLAVDDDFWERYCMLTGKGPKTAERPVDPSLSVPLANRSRSDTLQGQLELPNE